MTKRLNCYQFDCPSCTRDQQDGTVGKLGFIVSSCIALYYFAPVERVHAETRAETAVSYIEQGQKFARLGDFARAIRAYNIALQFSPDFAPAYFNRGLAYEAL